MKRIAILLTITIFAFAALTACGKKSEPAAQDTTAAAQTLMETDTTETTAAPDETAAVSESVQDETTEQAEEESTEEATEAETPQSVEDIVALYNSAVNKVKPEAKQITRTYHHAKIPTETLELNSGIQKLGEAAIKQFVKGSDKAEVWTSRSDFNLGFPVGGTDYSSRMKPDMVKTATCTDNGDTYTVRIILKNDAITNPKKGEGYAGVFNTVSASTFDEISIPTVTFEQVRINGINGSIVCTIDKASQRVTDITFSETDILDLSVKVAFSDLRAKMHLETEDHYAIEY